MEPSNEAEDRAKPHYVYILVDPRPGTSQPVFYVGKGQNWRAYEHGLQADQLEEDIPGSPKLARIREIEAAGESHKVRVLARFQTHEEAIAVESALISWMYGVDTLTNLVHGHGTASIRRRGDFDMLPGLDLPSRVIGERSGASTSSSRANAERYGVPTRLEMWRQHLQSRNYAVGEVDGTNAEGYKIVVEIAKPFAVHLVARSSSDKRVSIEFHVSSVRTPEALAAFDALAYGPTLGPYLEPSKGQGPIRKGDTADRYVYLKDYLKARDFEIDRVVLAIGTLENLISE